MSNTAKWLWQVPQRNRKTIALLTLLQALSGVTGVVFALLTKNIIDSAVQNDNAVFRHYVILLIILVLFQLAVHALIRWLREVGRADIENTLKSRLLGHILRKEYGSVSAVHTAEWINRLTNDTVVAANGYTDILPGLTWTTVRLVSALVMIIILDNWFALILIPGGIAAVILTYALRRVLKRLHKKIQESDGRLRIFLQEHIGSLMMIKSFAAEDQTLAGATVKMKEHKDARMKRNMFSNIANTGFGAAMQGMYIIGLVYCAHGMMTGRVTYGTLMAVTQLIGQIQGPFANISGYLPKWYTMSASAERLMEAEKFADDGLIRGTEEVRKFYDDEFTAAGLKNAAFTYNSEDDSRSVLKDVSLQIRKGETIAFTGQSGCGKSTVLKLLMGMYPLDEGERYLLTKDHTEVLDASWRRLFAYVPQGNVLMNGTIREVVSFSEPEAAYDDERLKHALQTACCEGFADDPDTLLGERGSGLSEGQMQRIAVARAVFSNRPVLLLDEASSALDEETEKRLLQNLSSLKDRTVVIVTHRRAALSICSRVLKFDEEGITETVISEE